MLDDIIENMKLIRSVQQKSNPVKPSPVEEKVAIRVSKQALNQPEVIALTPYGRNMNMYFGLPEGYRLQPGEAATKAEKWLTQQTEKMLQKYCGDEKLNYSTDLDPWDPDHYSVDCWRNFKRDDAIRHAVPKMNQARLEAFRQFERSIKDYDLIGALKHDHSAAKAAEYIWNDVPSVKTNSSRFYEVNLPFMTKHTNVGYPYYRNDQATASKGKTYGQLVMDEAKKLRPVDVIGYPFIAFGRNLRGKARPIFGGSRIQALVFNQLEHQEIEAYKVHSSLFVGYNNESRLKEVMRNNASWLMNHRNYTCFNRDYAKFDTTVFPSLRLLVSAISMAKAEDPYGKEIAKCRGASQLKAYLTNGLTNDTKLCYCRILSGEIDTNRSGGLANAFMDIWAMLQQDPEWVESADSLRREGGSPLMVMGDDNLMIQLRQTDNDALSDFIGQYGLNVSHEKGEYGIFFLQHRYFKRSDGNDIMIVPFTRVIRSLYSKEMAKGLGPCGWTVAAYSNLAALLEWPEILVDVAKMFAPFDDMALGAFTSLDSIKQGIVDEDVEAAKEAGKRSRSTAEKLWDGDPLKSDLFLPDGSLNLDERSPIARVHSILQQAAANDPGAFTRLKPNGSPMKNK